MKILGLELEKLVKLRQDRGVRIAGNDLLISADRMLPPPQIQGNVKAVRLEQGRMVLTFGSPGQPALSPPDRSSPNYMYYQGGTLAFGRLTMRDTELEIVDADPRDPFDFFLDHYNEQLVAGYDENLPDHGLLVHMPDYGKIGKRGGHPRQTQGRNPRPPREISALVVEISRRRSQSGRWRRKLVAVRAAEEGNGVSGPGMGVAFEARPGTAAGMPEVALELVGVRGVGGEHPAEEDVILPLPRVLQEPLAQVEVIAPHAFGDGAARAHGLKEIDARHPGRNRSRDVGLRQADGRLDARRRGKAGEERWLRRVGLGLRVPVLPGQPHCAVRKCSANRGTILP
jgi:hypothetical protein